MGRSSGALGRSWILLGDLGSILGPPRVDFGPSEGRFWTLRAQLGLHLAVQAGLQPQLGLHLAFQTGLREPPNELQANSKCSSIRTPCTPVCAAHPGLLNAKLCTVHLSVLLIMASWTPYCALYTRLCRSPWPVERQTVRCTPIGAAHPDRLHSLPCSVHPSVLVTLASLTPCYAMHTHLCCSPWPTI